MNGHRAFYRAQDRGAGDKILERILLAWESGEDVALDIWQRVVIFGRRAFFAQGLLGLLDVVEIGRAGGLGDVLHRYAVHNDWREMGRSMRGPRRCRGVVAAGYFPS